MTTPTDTHSILEGGKLFYPKLFSTIRSYNRELFLQDLTAGLIVGIVALPLAIAFAIASGVPPDKGLTTAIVAGFLISLLGGSRVQIGGPTGAFVVIVYSIVEKYGVSGLSLATIMAGGMLVVMGLLRLGAIIRYIPYTLTVGFTSGIAVVIFSSQIKDLFGLVTGPLPGDFVAKWQAYFDAIPSVDSITLFISLLSFGILFSWPKFNRKIPAPIVAIVVMTLFVHLFNVDVETIGSRFGAIPRGLPSPVWPSFTFAELQGLIGPAFTIAMLGAIESLLSATVADSMVEGRHRSNTELIAQGIANILTPLFGGIPATGAIARTATNAKNGGRTPVAGIVHALTLLVISLALAPWAGLIPMCVLATILIVVSYHMSEWRAFRSLLRAPRLDVAVMLVTFFLTLLADLTVAIEIGMLLSMVVFVQRMTEGTTVRQISRDMARADEDTKDAEAIHLREIPPGVDIYEAEGALFFGVSTHIRETLRIGKNPPKVLIFRMRHVLVVDATGMRAIEELHQACRKAHTVLILSGVRSTLRVGLRRFGLLDTLGQENVVADIDVALARAREIVAS